jgi:hypothetical protein
VGDYAFCLAENLKSDLGMDTLFIRTDASFKENSQRKFQEEVLRDKSSSGLCKTLLENKAGCVILHYVGYAYSSRGIPFWLVEGIEAWKRKKPDGKVIAIFHELYASGKIWQSAFWLRIFQKKLVFRLLKLSTHAIANTQITYDILKSAVPDKSVFLRPVFSNIGEPEAVPEFGSRNNALVIFGSAFLRDKIFKERNSLVFWSQKLKVNTIIEIGALPENSREPIPSLEIIQKGILPGNEVSEVMKKCRFGILSYPASLLTKSGVFAAYAAHGMVPVIINSGHHPSKDNLIPTAYYLSKDSGNEDFELISKNLKLWYDNYSVSKTAKVIFEMIKNQQNVSNN